MFPFLYVVTVVALSSREGEEIQVELGAEEATHAGRSDPRHPVTISRAIFDEEIMKKIWDISYIYMIWEVRNHIW